MDLGLDLGARVNQWLEGMRAGNGFRLAAGKPRTLLATCIAILLREGLESLGRAAAQERESWRRYVQSCQDPSTGRFTDPLMEQFPVENEPGGRAYFELMTTYFAIQALDVLGAPASHPLHFLERLEPPGEIETWLDGLDWSNPELESSRVMFMLAGLIHRAEKEEHPAAAPLYHRVLDWLDRAQDPETGLWGRQPDTRAAIAAAQHLVPFYEYVHRPVCAVSKIVDAALALAGLGGGAREDLAVVDLLATFAKQFDYRGSDIKKVLIGGFEAARNLQNADGGFSFAAGAGANPSAFGNWAPLNVHLGESDVWSSWLRTLALETIRCTYPEELPKTGGWRFRRWPGWGFHRSGAGLADGEKTLRRWIRPLPLAEDTVGDAAEAPDVTVVIPCYNLGPYLHEAVDSVLRQTLRTLEILVVDDGSTDEFTKFYLDAFSAPNTRVIHTQNQGLSAARNTGIEAARGRYICCLDADDRLRPAYLEKARRILDGAADVGFVSCYYENFDGAHSVYRYDHCRFPELLVQNEAAVVSVFRKDAWRKVGGYFTGLKAMEDWDFWIGILEQGYRGEVIPEILFEYRARIGSMLSGARQPENYSGFADQIIERRQTSYRTYFLDVLRLKTRQFAELAAVRQQELDQFAQANSWLQQQARNWEEVARQRQTDLAALETGRTWLEEQLRDWRQAAEQQRQHIAALESHAGDLGAELELWREMAEERRRRLAALEELARQARESIARLENRVHSLEAELERWRRMAEERANWIAELEQAKSWLAQQGESWRAAAEQGSRRIAMLEQTIAAMRATRTWRTAEWSVAALRRFSGACRDILLVASPRLAFSNARNFLLWMRLGSGDARAAWDAGFDAAYYRDAYPDVTRSGANPMLHYLLVGYREDRNPSASFDSAYYCLRHPDVRESGINPLLHFALFGRGEQRMAAPPVPAPDDPPPPAAPESLAGAPSSAEEVPPRKDVSSLEDRETPLISVIIPCFNYGAYVEQAVRSVLSQTFTNLEIIVVEGGSTDATTPEILRSLERKGLPKTRFLFRAESHLVGDNRNFGIAAARGRYVCCLDADDLLKPVYLEVAIFLTEFCGYDVVYPSVRSFEGDDFEWLLVDPTWPEIAEGNQISTIAVFRRAAWERAGGFRDWGKGEQYVPEDWELWVRLVGHGFRGKSIREPLMLYRVHGGGLWSTRGLPIEQQRQAIRDANPELFADAFSPVEAALDRPLAAWDRLKETAGSRPPILFALPFIITGGAEKVFAALARALIRRGHKVVIITTLTPAATIPDCVETFEEVTPYLFPLPRLLQSQEDRWRDFLFFLLKRHHIEMIFLAGCDFVYHLLPEIAREFPDISVFDQLFNDEVHFHTNRRYAAYIDATFVPSESLAAKLISECGEDSGKVSVIPHGIDTGEMAAPEATFESSKLPEHFRGKFLVSFFGRLSAEKAPADFVEIARSLRSHDDIRFLMTGEGQERAAVLELISRHNLQDRIHAPGFVEDMRPLLALSGVVVVPSHLDGMPLVVFEAQACGKPVVASARGSIPHVIADRKTGMLCAPGDIEGFAQRILELWRSPEKRRAIGDAARTWVRAHHSAEAMNAKYIEVFDRVQLER